MRLPHLPFLGVLDDASWHRLTHVLRMKPGDALLAFDGVGGSQRVLLGDRCVEADGPVRHAAAQPAIDLVVAVLKHSAMDLAVRMATEAGVRSIQPVLTERTVAKGDRRERWQRIVSTAATQCGRDLEPTVQPVRPLREITGDRLFYGQLGAPAPAAGSATLCIGPAGGFSPSELSWLSEHAEPVGLGPYVLRAETACAVGIGLLTRTQEDR